MPTPTANYNFIKDDENEYYSVQRTNENLDIIDEEIKKNHDDINLLEEQATIIKTTLSQQKSIFKSGTGKDEAGTESDFSDIVRGQSSVRIEGNTAMNLIKDGDFPNTTNWAPVNVGVPVVSNNEATFTATALGGGIIQSFKVVPNHKLYACAKILGSAEFLITDNLTMSYIVAHSANVGVYEKLSIYQQLASNNTISEMVIIRSNVLSGWEPVKVREVMCIDLTTLFGAGNEPTKEQCDIMYDHYINGLQGVSNHKIVSVGKNLFDKKTATINKSLNGNGDIVTDIGWSVSTYIRIKPLANYKLTNFFNPTVNCGWFDSNKKFISHASSSQSPSTACYFVGTMTTANVDSCMIEEGSVATEYEPYQSTELVTTFPTGTNLHRLPNGVQDIVEEVNGIKTLFKKTGEKTLTSTDTINMFVTNNNIDVAFLAMPSDAKALPPIGSFILVDKQVMASNYGYLEISRDNALDVGTIYAYSATQLGFIFAKGTTLAQAKTALTGVKIVYELANPLVYGNGLGNTAGDFRQHGNIEVYENGCIYQEGVTSKSYNNAKLVIDYNLSDKALEIANSKEITAINKLLKGRLKNTHLCDESGAFANADGLGNTATGLTSRVSGLNNVASGQCADAMGQLCEAYANWSTVSGHQTQTGDINDPFIAMFSSAHGYYTVAKGDSQAVFGRFNALSSTDLFQVGNGTSEAVRHNAIAVDGSGRFVANNGIINYPTVYSGTTLDTDAELTAFLNSFAAGVSYNCRYSFVVSLSFTYTGFGTGGNWVIDGYVSDPSYEWQTATCYSSSGLLLKARSKMAGGWTSWFTKIS